MIAGEFAGYDDRLGMQTRRRFDTTVSDARSMQNRLCRAVGLLPIPRDGTQRPVFLNAMHNGGRLCLC